MVFLFSDILIYARTNLLDKKEGGSRYSVQYMFPGGIHSVYYCTLIHVHVHDYIYMYSV